MKKDPYRTPVKQAFAKDKSQEVIQKGSLKERISTKIKASNQKTSKANFQSVKPHSHLQNHYSDSKGQPNQTTDSEPKPRRYQTDSKKQIGDKQNFCKSQNQKVEEGDVLILESGMNPGFYDYECWLQFNNSHYSHVSESYVKQLWKILRVLNYGEVLIPSGLIFELSKTLSQGKDQLQSLKDCLNSFLRLNSIDDTVDSFRQLRFYPSLEQIEAIYLNETPDIKQGSPKPQSEQNQKPPNVFERIYEDAKIRNQNRIEQVSRGLIQKQLFEQENMFRPQINRYYPERLFVDEEYEEKPERICHNVNKWKSRGQQCGEVLYASKNWNLGKIDESIFENSVEEIPGAQVHIGRQKYSQAVRQRQERYMSNPTLVCKYK